MAPTFFPVPRLALMAGVALAALVAAGCANGQSEMDGVPATAQAYAAAPETTASISPSERAWRPAG